MWNSVRSTFSVWRAVRRSLGAGLDASIAGIMISAVRYGGDPVAKQVYVLKSIAAVVLGGTGGPVNTLFGTLLMSVLDNGMNVAGVDPYFQQSILGSTIIVPSY